MIRNHPHRYFFSIFFTSLLSFGLIAVILFSIAYLNHKWESQIKAVREFTKEKNTVMTHVHVMYTKILTKAQQISTDTFLRRWILLVPGYEDPLVIQKLFNNLHSVATTDDDIHTINVIDTRRQVILSTYFGYRTPDQGDAYGNLKKEIFSRFFSSHETTSLLRTYSNSIPDSDSTLNFLLSLPERSKLGAISITFRLDNFLPPYASLNDRIWAIGDSAGTIISNHPDIAESSFSSLEDSPDFERSSPFPSEIIINSRTYWYTSEPVFDNSYLITLAVPRDILFSESSALLKYAPFVILFIFSLSVIASFILYNKARKPILAAVDNARTQMNLIGMERDDSSKTGDAISNLNKTLNTLILQTKSSRRIISENRDFLHENALRNLLFGRRRNIHGRSFYEREFINEDNNYFLVLALRINEYGDDLNPGGNNDAFLDPELLEKIKDGFVGGTLKTGLRSWALLLNLEKHEDKRTILKRINLLQDSGTNMDGVQFNAACSTIVRNTEAIPDAYDQAVECLRRCLMDNTRNLLDAADLKDKKPIYYFSVKDGQNLIAELRIQNRQQITAYTKKLVYSKIEMYSPELMDAYCLYLFSCAAKVAMEYNLSADVVAKHTYSSVLESSEPINRKVESLAILCKEIVESRDKEQKRFKSLSLEIALNYINENYTKPISLSIIADNLHVSTSYLSELLKRSLGMSYIQYINKLRIEKSLELLQNSDLTIKKISKMIGYDTEHSFIRNFKRAFGRTPADYRNRTKNISIKEKTYISENDFST
ncbi:AraC family transcriptional regulator [Marispirochaeta aestuarii]|uniref:AraC family transcriptional regulator n=1 Tax=Marispirochaeta aestuarii TaxID=1963862 RepID=UPI0029C93E07|nr:AraC family transcriptional regulator [Marispirochaeta aestuarii]